MRVDAFVLLRRLFLCPKVVNINDKKSSFVRCKVLYGGV